VPKCCRARIQASKAPGTIAASNPLPGIISILAWRNHSTVARAGAVPWPLIATVRAVHGSWISIGASPPIPLSWGLSTARARPAATPASTALPPRSNMRIPAALAR